jgi:putative component of membrane protein insertase Oxa1/YidC/SpoIIIJ protein YidD
MSKLCLLLVSSVFTILSFSASSQALNSIKESSSADYIGFYQKYISGIRGQSCPMYPSCSNYALAEFKQKDFLFAFVKSSDRLIRCGHDLSNYNLTVRPEGIKYLDYPGENNAPNNLIYKNTQEFYSFADTVHKVDSALIFIRSLINNGYYPQALLEIKRIEFNKATINAELFTNELICLKALGEYEKAIYEYEVKCPPHLKTHPEILYVLASIEYKLENMDRAASFITIALTSSPDGYQTAKLLALQGLIFANQYQWVKSKESFNSISTQLYRQDLKAYYLKTLENSNNFKYKSPATASFLSIIPGLGYAYTGHKQTAISSFILNGILGYATYSSIKSKNYGLATLTGVFSASFYIANIYGANKSARRFNDQQRKDIINKLETNIKP